LAFSLGFFAFSPPLRFSILFVGLIWIIVRQAIRVHRQ
jgi:hypothetical protein